MTNNSRTAIILLIITTIFLRSCYPRLPGETKKPDWGGTKWISFEWAGNSIGDKYFDKVAMFVAVMLEGIPQKFKAQLDPGSAASIVYGNSSGPIYRPTLNT